MPSPLPFDHGISDDFDMTRALIVHLKYNHVFNRRNEYTVCSTTEYAI